MRNNIRDYLAAATFTVGAVCEVILYPLTVVETVVVLAAVCGGWLLLRSVKIARQVLISLAAVILLIDAVVLFSRFGDNPLPLWTWAIALSAAVVGGAVLGADAVRHAALPLGCACLVLLGAAFVLSFGQLDLPASAASGLSMRIPCTVITLLGGGFTAVELGGAPRAARWGGVTGTLLWLSAQVTVIGMWCDDSRRQLTVPLAMAWRRIKLGATPVPADILLTSLVGVAALWQIIACACVWRPKILQKLCLYKS